MRLNIKKIPSKNWTYPVFEPQILESNSIRQLVLSNNANEKINCIFLTNSIFKVYYSTNSVENSFYEKFSWTLQDPNFDSSNNFWKLENQKFKASSTLPNNKNIHISYDPSNASFLSYLNDTKEFSFIIRQHKQKNWLSFEIEINKENFNVFGLGEQTAPMDKKGKKFIFWNTDNPLYKTGSTPLYQSWPIALVQFENSFYAFIFDNPAYTEIDLKEKGKIKYFVHDFEVNFYVLNGTSYKDIVQQIATLSGKIYPLPKWSLGYQQSRYSYTPSNRVREIAKTFREKNIPCDVIYLDIHYMDHYKCFTFGEEFSDYKSMISELHDQGFKVVPIIDPGIKKEQGYFAFDEGIKNNYFIRDSKNELITIKVWPGECHYPDFINEDARNWWSGIVHNFIDQSGVDGIWCDMNEPATFDARRTLQPDALHQFKENIVIVHEKIHNIFGFFMTKATLEGAYKSTKTPFVMTRSSYIGGQKYASTWTGDNHSEWSHLKNSIPMILSFGLCGQPVVGPDIGGFGGVPEPKLYERWIEQGAFYPYSRTHTGLGTPNQEPWSFGDEIEDKGSKALKLRYKLIPYYYSLLYEAHTKGFPIMRPIFFNEENSSIFEKEYYETEFLIGDFLLFTPFMNKSNKRDIFLPKGYWYSWWKREELFEGHTVYPIIEEDYDPIPIFLKDEAIIPMTFNNLEFIPQESQKELALLLIVKDSKEALTFDFIEYFDTNCTLGLKISTKKEENIINLLIEEIRIGEIPKNYFLPTTIKFEINYFVRNLVDLNKDNYEILTDKEDWSTVALHSLTYPLDVKIDCLF